MTYSEIKVLESLIKNELGKRFPVVRIYVSNTEKASIIFSFSVDKSSTWIDGIFENSKYYSFSVSYKGDVNCFETSVEDFKFTKFTEPEPGKCLTKIIKVLDSIKNKKVKKVTV